MKLNRYSLAYFNWLSKMVYLTKNQGYEKLGKKLNRMNYRWTILGDDNRESDGIALRSDFINSQHIHSSCVEGECSMLEMLIALAQRIDDICFDSTYNSQLHSWFWQLLGNLGLDMFSDKDYENCGGDEKINEIVDIMLDRKYDYDGHGSLFPVKRSPSDYRKIEIFNQMYIYLNERDYRL